jgi:DNA-binding FadR family transcriptional regulator
MRRGPGGGLIVVEPDPKIVRTAARLYLRRINVRRAHLLEVRTALEVAAVSSAIAQLNQAGIRSLEEVRELEEQSAAQGLTDGHAFQLHGTIASLTGNPAMELFVELLAQLDSDIVRAKWDTSEEPLDRARKHEMSRKAHKAIVEAMVARNSTLAQHRMRKHLGAIADLIE